MTKLIALALITAGTVAGISADIPAGSVFEVVPEAAEPLLTQGLAQLADTPIAANKPKPVKVRVLLACQHGQPDEVVTLPADVAKLAEAAGQVDGNKAAVAYALTLQQNA